jgi:hypothetical protein
MDTQELNSGFNKYFGFIDNEYVSATLHLLLILYVSLIAPKLPYSIAQLFDYTVVKLIAFFLIVYLSSKNPTTAIIVAVGVLVTLMTLNHYKSSFEMMTFMEDIKAHTKPEKPHSMYDFKHNQGKFKTMDQENKDKKIVQLMHRVENMKQNLQRDLTQEELDSLYQSINEEQDVESSLTVLQENANEIKIAAQDAGIVGFNNKAENYAPN